MQEAKSHLSWTRSPETRIHRHPKGGGYISRPEWLNSHQWWLVGPLELRGRVHIGARVGVVPSIRMKLGMHPLATFVRESCRLCS